MTIERPEVRSDLDVRRDEMRQWEEKRALGRRGFMIRYGLVGWGIPAALLTIAYAVFAEQGLAMDHETFSTKLRIGIAAALVIFPTLGHYFGGRLWTAGEDRYEENRRRTERR